MKLRAFCAFLVSFVLLLAIPGGTMAAPNTRALGMGGAYLAVINDGQAPYLNPAVLPFLSGPVVTFQYGSGYLPGSLLRGPEAISLSTLGEMGSFPYLGLANPTSDSGLAYGLFAYRTSMYTARDFDYGGSHYNPTIGEDTDIGYSLACEILPGLSVGGTVRLGYITTDHPWVNSKGLFWDPEQYLHVGIDAAVLYRPVPQLALSLSVLDVNQAKITFQPSANVTPSPSTTPQPVDTLIRFPYQLRWGAAFMLPPYLTLAVDMNSIPQSFSEIVSTLEVGGEFRLNTLFALRAGSYRGTLTLGAGLGVPFQGAGVLSVDYAYVADAEGRHFVSASWLF